MADVVCVTGSSSAVNVLVGSGDGELSPALAFDDVAGLRDLALADIDSDGDVDVIVTSATGVESVLYNVK